MKNSKKIISILMLVSFFISNVAVPAGAASAGGLGTPSLITSLPREPNWSATGFQPPVLLGLKIHPENPLLFDFIVDEGVSKLSDDELKLETEKLVKYFLAALTIPDKEVWVNLSPTEKDRIIPDVLGQTVMGKTMLEQDYMLKQLASSLTNPDTDLGKKYWKQVNSVLANEASPVGTNEVKQSMSKVWIVPAKAEVLESQGIVLVGEKRLKVMMDEERSPQSLSGDPHAIFRSLILPKIEKEINEGKNFADVRQIYNSVILATWYKQTLKESLLGKVYADKGKVAGVETDDKEMKQRIYEQYLEAFKKGAYNLIKEEVDSSTGEMIPRKYFSGGISPLAPEQLTRTSVSSGVMQSRINASSALFVVTVQGTETKPERQIVKKAQLASSLSGNAEGQSASSALSKDDLVGEIELQTGFMKIDLDEIEPASLRGIYDELKKFPAQEETVQVVVSDGDIALTLVMNTQGEELTRVLALSKDPFSHQGARYFLEPVYVHGKVDVKTIQYAFGITQIETLPHQVSASSAIFTLTPKIAEKLNELKTGKLPYGVANHLTEDVVRDILMAIHTAFTYAKWTSKYNEEIHVQYDPRPGSSYQLQQARELIAQEILGMRKEGNFLYFRQGSEYPPYADFLSKLEENSYLRSSLGGVEESLAKAESVPLGEVIPVGDATNIIRQFRIAKTPVPLSALLTFAKHVGRLQVEDGRQKYSFDTAASSGVARLPHIERLARFLQDKPLGYRASIAEVAQAIGIKVSAFIKLIEYLNSDGTDAQLFLDDTPPSFYIYDRGGIAATISQIEDFNRNRAALYASAERRAMSTPSKLVLLPPPAEQRKTFPHQITKKVMDAIKDPTGIADLDRQWLADYKEEATTILYAVVYNWLTQWMGDGNYGAINEEYLQEPLSSSELESISEAVEESVWRRINDNLSRFLDPATVERFSKMSRLDKLMFALKKFGFRKIPAPANSRNQVSAYMASPEFVKIVQKAISASSGTVEKEIRSSISEMGGNNIAENINSVGSSTAVGRGREGQENPGGIDFDPTNMNLQIKRDGKGVPLPLPQQNLEQINIEGLFPVIINIVPVNAQTLPIFLGAVLPVGEQAPQEPAKEPPGEGRPELAASSAS